MIAGYWILAEFFFFFAFLWTETKLRSIDENGKKKNETNTRQTSNHHDWTSLVNNGFIIKQRNFALSRMKYNWFISRAGKESLTFFCHYLRLHPWYCPRITNFISLREIKAGNPDRTRGTHLSRSGNQSEHFA